MSRRTAVLLQEDPRVPLGQEAAGGRSWTDATNYTTNAGQRTTT